MQVSLFEAAAVAHWQREYTGQIFFLQCGFLYCAAVCFVKVQSWFLLRKWSFAGGFTPEMETVWEGRKWEECFDLEHVYKVEIALNMQLWWSWLLAVV